MSCLIFNNKVIATGIISDNADFLESSNGEIYAKSMVEGAFIIDLDIPSQSKYGWLYIDGGFVEDKPIQKEFDLSKANKIRLDRNSKLQSSDWTQLSDSPVDKSAWSTYRQALRDITKLEGFPESIQWPTEPTGV